MQIIIQIIINHHRRNVFNGSQLDKQFSANRFNKLFTQPSKTEFAYNVYVPTQENIANISQSTSENDQIHPHFDFLFAGNVLSSHTGLLDILLLNSFSDDK
ncbi:hypothetical protein EG344_01805 [Chryseobacterium sp. G0162]|uniref:hypothetical protein n=1 Tax=Chryseobacterium sp. G0162 TaxID=2487063 RepID=UPI000F4DBA03|nr:hypothetical protein [Chryseobacterium sp. G0162]AZB07666.1 hypothetical protein EG344_01805 [Chryseobacterium sp. G0162]